MNYSILGSTGNHDRACFPTLYRTALVEMDATVTRNDRISSEMNAEVSQDKSGAMTLAAGAPSCIHPKTLDTVGDCSASKDNSTMTVL